MSSPSHTSLLTLLKGRVPHCRGKLLDNTRIPPSLQTLRDLNNVVTEVVTSGADELPAAAEGSLTVCSSCRYFKSVGGLRQALCTIDLASRTSEPKGLLRTLSLSEPCISTSRVAMATVRYAGKMGSWEERLRPSYHHPNCYTSLG
jgi:hypothetical protein